MGTKKMIMILPPGRVFIENGGYVKEINRRLEQESLIKSNTPSKLNQKNKNHIHINYDCFGRIFRIIYG